MIAYFEYSQDLPPGHEFEPVTSRSVLTILEGGITEANKATAREFVDSAQVEEAHALLEGLGMPYYVRVHFHDHLNQNPCEVENL